MAYGGCGCGNGWNGGAPSGDRLFDHHPDYARPVPGGCRPCGPRHHNQAPTFSAFPCDRRGAPPFFNPMSPPWYHGMRPCGCCPPPPSPTIGPADVRPSRIYPEPPPCTCGPDPMPPHPYMNPLVPMHPGPHMCVLPNAPVRGRHPPYGFPPGVVPPPCGPHGDPNHPSHYPGISTPLERPEPYYGTLKIVEHSPTADHEMTAVQYADGRYGMIANGYIPDDSGSVVDNGPKCMPWDDVRGNTSMSEGMDVMNYQFNNSDNGATF